MATTRPRKRIYKGENHNKTGRKTQKSASILHYLFPRLKADGFFRMGL